MIEPVRTAIFMEGDDLIELERILAAKDAGKAFAFLKESVYERVVRIQRGR